MHVDMVAPKHSCTVIHSVGFAGEKRGTLRVQYKDAKGNLSSLGDYLDVPRALWNQLNETKIPRQFVAAQIKPYFQWVPSVSCDEDYAIDETLGPVVHVPADVPNNVESITVIVDAQRIRTGLFL